MKTPVLVLSIAVILSFASGAHAQTDGARAAQIQKLYEFSQNFQKGQILPVRGGNGKRPLGVYKGGKIDNVTFKSGYKDVAPKTQCEWAYDLNKFIQENGGGWDNYKKYAHERKLLSDAQETMRRAAGQKDAGDPFDRAHVPYDKQAAFADTWWKKNSLAFKKTVVPPKDWWLHEAVLDGNNLWTRYEQFNGKGTSDYGSWRDAELETLIHKQ